MTSFQIQCFLSVAEYLNFTEAANHLFVAQSSLSRNISNLEAELGMSLFVRTKKYVRLTPSGAVLYDEFSRLTKLGEAAIEKARNAELGETGALKLGVIETQRSENFLPGPLNSLRNNHPNIQIDIMSGTFRELREAVLHERIDIALTMDFDLADYPPEDIVYQVFFCSTPKCVIAKSHPLAKQTPIPLDALRTETMIAISPEVSKGAYHNIIHFCERHGFSPARTIYANSIQDILLKVEAGLGFSVLDENCISYSNAAVLSLPFQKTDPLYLVAIWKKANLNPVIPLFMNFLNLAD
jgi:DNA-binding transcriptional LysR family regulator